MFYDFASFAVRLLLAVLARCSVEGTERLPRDGAFLIISNHLSLIDPPVLGALIPRRIVFMAKEELFHAPIIGQLVSWYGAFAIRRGEADRQALRKAVGVLEHGQVLGMFPEGTRSKTGKMNEAHPGAALIALLSGATVVPVAITGTDRVRSPLSLLARPRIAVRVGEPFKMERVRSRKENLEHATREMMGRVAVLLPEERRGFYEGAAMRNGRGGVIEEGAVK